MLFLGVTFIDLGLGCKPGPQQMAGKQPFPAGLWSDRRARPQRVLPNLPGVQHLGVDFFALASDMTWQKIGPWAARANFNQVLSATTKRVAVG